MRVKQNLRQPGPIGKNRTKNARILSDSLHPLSQKRSLRRLQARAGIVVESFLLPSRRMTGTTKPEG